MLGLWCEPVLVWVSLELLFLVLLATFNKSSTSVGLLVVFYASEVLASLCLLLGFFLGAEPLISVFFLWKLGVAPFWFWVVSVFESTSLRSALVCMTAYKCAVMVLLLSYLGVSWVVLSFSCVSLLGVFLLGAFVLSKGRLVCLFMLVSVAWLMLSSFSTSAMVWFYLIYCFMALCLVWGFDTRWGLAVGVMLFYVGFPPFPSFLLKLYLVSGAWSFSGLTALLFWFVMVVFVGWGLVLFTFEGRPWLAGLILLSGACLFL